MASNFVLKFTSTERTPDGERVRSLKVTFAIGAVVVSLVAAMFAAAGYINRDDLPYFFSKMKTSAATVRLIHAC